MSLEHGHNRRPKTGSKWYLFAIIAGVLLVTGGFSWALISKTGETDRADTAVQQGQDVQEDGKELARGIEKACAQKVTAVAQYCAKAKEVIAQPPIEGKRGEPGATGAVGPTGPTGPPGARGSVGPSGPPGKAGATGAPGGDSTIPGSDGSDGTDGANGTPGADSTIQGPAGPVGPQGTPGADSTVAGPQGEAGRGVISVSCEANHLNWGLTFTFTYSDGTEQRIECAETVTPAPLLAR